MIISEGAETHGSTIGEQPAKVSADWKPEKGDQQGWVRATIEADASPPPVAFGEPRFRVMQRISQAGLRHTPYVSLSLDEFLSNPQGFIATIPAPEYIIYVEPKVAGSGQLKRYKGLSPLRVLETCKELERIFPIHDCMVTVLAAPPLELHGAALVLSDGLLLTADFVTGDSQHVSRPGITPKYRITQDQWTDILKYSFEDVEIRQVLYNSLQVMPRSELTGRFGQSYFRPGYYELVICRDLSGQRDYFLHDMKGLASRL